jgi:hypothetical protein
MKIDMEGDEFSRYIFWPKLSIAELCYHLLDRYCIVHMMSMQQYSYLPINRSETETYENLW